MEPDRSNQFGVVAIGRNEGERLKQCLKSVSSAAKIVYVDSGSLDDSVRWAKEAGITVVELDLYSGTGPKRGVSTSAGAGTTLKICAVHRWRL
jgi:glycosyltransferase involved in cell wall biosynthesis